MRPKETHLCLLLLVRLGGYIVNLSDFYSYRLIGKLTVFFATSGVQLAQTDRDQFHYHRATVSSQLKTRVVLTLAKASALRINLNLDGSSSTTNPVCARCVNLLVCSLPLHRHSYIGFIFSFRFIDS